MGNNTNQIANLWVAEYSPSQKAFHVETLCELIQRNEKFIHNHIREKRYFPDYLLLGVFRSHDEASRAIHECYQPKIEEWQELYSLDVVLKKIENDLTASARGGA